MKQIFEIADKVEIGENEREKILLQLNKNNKKTYIFGTKETAQIIFKGLLKLKLEISAFLDEDKSLKFIENTPVIDFKEIEDKSSLVIIARIEKAPHIREILFSLGLNNTLDYIELTKFMPEIFPLPDNLGFQIYREVLDNMDRDIKENKEKYLEFYGLLEDEKSKEVFRAVMEFRLTLKTDEIRKICEERKNIYLEDFINFKENEIFIDAGSFDGDSAYEFIQKNKKYKKIYCFEPDFNLLEKAKKKLKDFENVEFIQKGIYSENRNLCFYADGGQTGKISDNGNCNIEVVKIDDYLHEKFTYLKMDIEGSEMEALKGAVFNIREYKPILAISIYHKADDFWRIPLFIKELNKKYKFYIRHYTEGIADTVLYCI